MLTRFVVVAAAFADASPLRLDTYMSPLSTTFKPSMKTHCSLTFALLKRISLWKRGMISSSRISAANSLMSREISQTHPHCCFASPSSRRPFSNGTETASPPASPGRPAPTRRFTAGLLAIQSPRFGSQRSRTVSPRKTSAAIFNSSVGSPAQSADMTVSSRMHITALCISPSLLLLASLFLILLRW